MLRLINQMFAEIALNCKATKCLLIKKKHKHSCLEEDSKREKQAEKKQTK